MKNLYYKFAILFLLFSFNLQAQQLPNNTFEDWSGETFDGEAQPASWHYSNVTQFGFKFNFAHKETGHNGGSCIMMQDQSLKVAGIGETSPGYISLGQPWVYIESLTKVDEATAGTYGGISWKYRPDTMVAWIKRTGSDAMSEDFHLLYYSWTGTSYSDSYKGKNGNCTETENYDEESDVREMTDKNECGIKTTANQVAEGWYRARAVYNDWVQIKVPIYYLNNSTPEKVNVIFSASNYPNFRANSGLYVGNSLYVDDVQLIYSSQIQQLFIGGKEWRAFKPNSTDIQYYTIEDESIKTIPTIRAKRGAGKLTNSKGGIAQFYGRELQGDEITIEEGEIDGKLTTITVRAEDGSSETTYKIQFMHKASSNAKLNGIQVGGNNLKEFNANITSYTVTLNYGTTEVPVVTATKGEEDQQVDIQQATSLTDTTKITVIAPDHTTKKVYTLTYKVAELSDNTLQNILYNGISVPKFLPTSSQSYTIDLPLGTTEWPTIEYVSKYADTIQQVTITYDGETEKANATIHEGSVIALSVTTPGNKTPKVYQLIIHLTKSTNATLNMIYLDGDSLEGFAANKFSYQVTLPLGTETLPKITCDKAEQPQTITITDGGLNGTTSIVVTAQDVTISKTYKITFTIKQSSVSTLNAILLDGDSLQGFDPTKTSYSIALAVGTTEVPEITVIKADENEKVSISVVGMKAYIIVTAGDGTSTMYQLQFGLTQSTNAKLCSIMVGEDTIPGFNSTTLNYTYILPKGTTELPVISYTVCDTLSTVTTRSAGITGDYKIIVKPQSGFSQTYTIRFSVEKSTDVALRMIYLNGDSLPNFHADSLMYSDTLDLPLLPTITYDKNEASQKVSMQTEGNTVRLKVTAENGDTRTYTILFNIRVSTSTTLQMIYLNGDSLKGFDKEKVLYDSLFLTADKTCPIITVDKSVGQIVHIITPKGAGTAEIIVTAGNGAQSSYLLTFVDTTIVPIQPLEPNPTYLPESDVTLQTILIDGTSLIGFTDAVHAYFLTLEAGSSMPAVSFVPKTQKQSVAAGAVAYGTFQAHVTAENGDTASYSVQISIKPYSNALLSNIQVENQEIQFDPETYTYEFTIEDGESLPDITYTTNEGQNVLSYSPNENEQQLIVTAEDGTQSTYTITYKREMPNVSNTLLKDILLDGKSLLGFRSDSFNYVDTLAWRSTVVPMVNAIGTNIRQTITTYFSAVNGTTRIHVVAADGVTTADYTIAFPVRQSGNVQLKQIYMDYQYADFNEVPFAFDPEQTDYTIEVPYNATTCPAISYVKAEQEQMVSSVLRPMGEKNEFTVKAENGETLTYSITFVPKKSPYNSLKSIQINESIDLDLSDSTKREFTIDLPFGTKTFNVNYTKKFDEQSVMVQPGGIYHPTILTVFNNIENNSFTTYTINPLISSNRSLELSSILINGSELPEFKPDRYNYVFALQDAYSIPIVQVEHNKLFTVTIEQDTWHWKATVTNKLDTLYYTIFWHYTKDIIPNGEFTQWTKTEKTSSYKPTNWNATNDYVGDYNAESYVTQASAGIVELYSIPHTTLDWVWSNYMAAPAVINLANMTATQVVSGFSRTKVFGTIAFHNTPDTAAMNYKLIDLDADKKGALFQFRFEDSKGNFDTISHQQSTTQTNFTTKKLPLNLDRKHIRSFDAIVDASSASLNEGKGAHGGKIQVDYIRFIYNNTLTRVFVDSNECTKNNNTFSYTMSSSINDALPKLSFEGEVSDQAQKVDWQAPVVEGEYSVRRATITNYGEDGNSSIYTLDIKRPIDKRSTLKSLTVGGQILDCSKGQEYTYHLTAEMPTLPDIVPELENHLQTCTTTYQDSVATIQVTSEKGEMQTYRIRFVKEVINDAQLNNIVAEGISFQEQEQAYILETETMPEITIYKRHDHQTVSVQEGTIQVTSPFGATQQYQINLQPTIATTSGQFTDIVLDTESMEDFDANTYAYKHVIPEIMSFTRKDDADSVVYIRTKDSLVWHIYGSEQHTYKLTKPMEVSSSTELRGIYINGALMDGFSNQRTDYTIYSDTAIQLTVQGSESAQTILTNESNNTYTIQVTAQDQTTTASYQVQVSPVISSDATLSAIILNGDTLSGFQPDSTSYTIIIPAGKAKAYEPVVPSIRYETSNKNASVDVELGGLGETTYLNVMAQDGIHTQSYQLLFTAEPSHNAYLSMIAIQDQPLADFDSTRTYYSVQLPKTAIDSLQWRSNDRFQTITQSTKGDIYIIRVVAQDGTTTNDYWVQIYHEVPSSDATLANVKLDSLDLAQFDTTRNANLMFQSGQNHYEIFVPSSTTTSTLPCVSAIAKVDGQAIQFRQDSATMTIYIDVTAPDGMNTNTYSLQFTRILSSNTDLQLITLNAGDTLSSFAKDQYLYFIDLEVGQTELPHIEVLPAEPAQVIQQDTVAIDSLQQQITITVTAENKTSTAQYMLIFRRTLSDDAKLQNLEVSPAEIAFSPDTFYYAIVYSGDSLPTIRPTIDSVLQKAYVDTLGQTDLTITYQVTVVAENGNTNRYVVTFTKQLSNNAQLNSIKNNHFPLNSFLPSITTYIDTLQIGDSILLEWERDDTLSTVVRQDTMLAGIPTTRLIVTAQDSSQCIYTIYFVTAPSKESTLKMICSNKDSFNIDEQDTQDFNIRLLKDETLWPAIAFEKRDSMQQVEVAYSPSDSTVTITVTAPDGQTQSTYTIHYLPYISDNALLKDLQMDGKTLADFTDINFGPYNMELDSLQLPSITYEPAEPHKQTIAIDTTYTPNADSTYWKIAVEISVTAEDKTTTEKYSLIFTYSNPNTLLKSIAINNEPLKQSMGFTQDFQPEIMHYYITYPVGTNPDSCFIDTADVKATAQDTNAMVIRNYETTRTAFDIDGIEVAVETEITITVSLDNHSRTYTIHQRLLLDSLNRTTQILVANFNGQMELLHDFHTNSYYYEYTLPDTRNNAPAFELLYANTNSRFAYWGLLMNNNPRIVDGDDNINYANADAESDPTYQLCYYAEDGTEYIYKIKFQRTAIKRAQKPMEGDVLIQHIPGSCQIAVASLRANVVFTLYDMSGRMIELHKLGESDPNSFNTVTDGFGQTYFGSMSDYSSCTIITLQPNKVYFWVFTENGKRKIKSGKIAIIP